MVAGVAGYPGSWVAGRRNQPGSRASGYPGIQVSVLWIVYVYFKIQRVLLIIKREKPTKWVVGATVSPPTLSPLSPKEKREKEKLRFSTWSKKVNVMGDHLFSIVVINEFLWQLIIDHIYPNCRLKSLPIAFVLVDLDGRPYIYLYTYIYV